MKLLLDVRARWVGAETFDQATVEAQTGFHIFQELGRDGFYLPVLDVLLGSVCPQARSGDGCNLPRPHAHLSFSKGESAGLLDCSYSSVLKPAHTI